MYEKIINSMRFIHAYHREILDWKDNILSFGFCRRFCVCKVAQVWIAVLSFSDIQNKPLCGQDKDIPLDLLLRQAAWWKLPYLQGITAS